MKIRHIKFGQSHFYSSNTVAYLLTAIVLLAGILWTYNLGSYSLWGDETLSILHARSLTSVSSVLSMQFFNAHPPLYFILLRAWLFLGGESESWTRLLSVLFALLTIPFVYKLGRLLFSSSTGVIASLLYSIMPLMLIYNREVRMYSLLVMLSCLSLLLLLRCLEEDRTADWILFSLFTFMTLITHYHGFLILLAQGIFFLLRLARVHNRSRFIFKFMLASFVAILLFIPFIPALREALGTTGEMWRSGAKSILVSRGYLIFSLTLGQTIMPWNPIALIGGLGIAALFVNGIWNNRSNHNFLLLLVSYGFVVFVVGPAISHDMPRYYLFMIPLICIGIAIGITSMKSRIMSLVFTTMLLFSWVVSGINYYTGHDFHVMATVDPWREVAKYLQEHIGDDPTSKIIVNSSPSLTNYYLPRYGLQNRLLTDNVSFGTVDICTSNTLWLVVGNPVNTISGKQLRQDIMNQCGFTVVDTIRFLRDPKYMKKNKFFNKEFAEFRVEVFKLHR